MADDLSLEIDKRTIEKIVAQLSPDAFMRATLEGDDVIGRVGNNMRYAPYVIGDDQTQAKVHQGRWYQLPVVVKDNLDEVRDAIEAEWQSAMNGNS